MNTNNKFEWFASGNAPVLFPTELVIGRFVFDDLTAINIPESTPFAADWGEAVSMHLLPEKYHPAPKHIMLSWLSITESKFYAVIEELPEEQIAALLSEKDEKTKKPKYNTLIAGMAPYGKVAIWLSGNGITTEVAWLQGEAITFDMQRFAPGSTLTQEAYSKAALAESEEACKNFQKNGLPDPALFERYMQKFNYRITPKFGKKAEFSAIELSYYNGEADATNSGEHATNAMRAKPRKIALHWHVKKREFSAYFWTDEKKIIDIFDQFYKENAQQNGELLIEVDESNQEFKFTLQDKFIAIEIPTEAMEMIIFKNKIEFFRSKNYSKSTGEWRK